MSPVALGAALRRTTAYAVGVTMVALGLAATVPLPSAEVFTTIGYIAAVVTACAMAATIRLPRTRNRHRTTLRDALRSTPVFFSTVAVAALFGDALLAQPRGEVFGAIAYIAAIGAAVAVGIRCVSAPKT